MYKLRELNCVQVEKSSFYKKFNKENITWLCNKVIKAITGYLGSFGEPHVH